MKTILYTVGYNETHVYNQFIKLIQTTSKHEAENYFSKMVEFIRTVFPNVLDDIDVYDIIEIRKSDIDKVYPENRTALHAYLQSI
jgi:hypothetical protein